MTMRNRCTTIAAMSLALLIAASSSATAQDEHEKHHPQGALPASPQTEPPSTSQAPSQMPGGGMMGNMAQGGMMGMMATCPMPGMMMGGSDVTSHANGRIAFLKTELAITDVQKTAWDAYALALRENLESLKSMRHTMANMMKSASPVERLDMHIAVVENRIATLKRIQPALANLYAALSDEQKNTADQVLTGMSCLM